jgi:hypothetical protein
MSSTESQELRQLCKTQGLLAAVLLLQPEPRVWLGGLNQSDYAQLLLLSQTQSLPILFPRVDAVQLSSQAVLVHSQVLSNKSLAMLVFPFETRLKELDQTAAAFLDAIETGISQTRSQTLLDGLRARQVETTSSNNEDLLALFSGMPEADPSSEATKPFHVSTLSVQILEKSLDSWKQIF